MPARNSRNWVERMMVLGIAEATISFSWATLAEVAVVGRLSSPV
jgi:hypothetical protein